MPEEMASKNNRAALVNERLRGKNATPRMAPLVDFSLLKFPSHHRLSGVERNGVFLYFVCLNVLLSRQAIVLSRTFEKRRVVWRMAVLKDVGKK